MRKIPLAAGIILLLCSCNGAAVAQGVSLGLAAGINQSSVTSEELPEVPLTRTGIHLGAFLEFESAGPVGFRLGASYTQKGFNLDTGEEGVSRGLRLPYIEVPLLLVVTVPTGPTSTVSPRFFAGPAVSLKAGCDVVASAEGVSASVSCEEADVYEIKAFDAGLMAGGGLAIGAGPFSVTLDATYTLGFMNLNETGSDTVKNRNLSFSLGVIFPLSVR